MLNNYEILSQIGVGGMGKVLLGKHKLFDRAVAIKCLSEEYVNNRDIRLRFRQEASTLSILEHPNIVKLYDFIEEDNNCYLIMEYVDGVTIDQYISSYGKFNLHLTLEIFKKILVAIEYAHGKNIIHRDIKPSNIILSELNPKILDFGIAKLLNDNRNLTRAGSKVGSILYMSPEQVLGKDVTPASDIYSLGVLLYEMLTGRNPYNLNTESDYFILDCIVKKSLDHVTDFDCTLPDELDNIIFKATVKDPQFRHYSCSEFAEALSRVNTSYSESERYQEPDYEEENNYLNDYNPQVHIRSDIERTIYSGAEKITDEGKFEEEKKELLIKTAQKETTKKLTEEENKSTNNFQEDDDDIETKWYRTDKINYIGLAIIIIVFGIFVINYFVGPTDGKTIKVETQQNPVVPTPNIEKERNVLTREDVKEEEKSDTVKKTETKPRRTNRNSQSNTQRSHDQPNQNRESSPRKHTTFE